MEYTARSNSNFPKALSESVGAQWLHSSKRKMKHHIVKPSLCFRREADIRCP